MKKGLHDLGNIKIGNNVFVGNNSIVLPGTSIGDNIIIGAGAVVTGNIESNSIYVGVPARKISSIENYAKKKEHLCINTKGFNYSEKKEKLINL